jgi:aminotransferase class I and II
MRLPDFKLERYFARWEFDVRHTLCASDLEGWRLDELLALADEEGRALWRDLTLGYTESPGHPLLRAEIASLYDGVAPEEILTFAGAEEAIFVIMNVLLGPGDHASVTWPGYQSLYAVARATGPRSRCCGWRRRTAGRSTWRRYAARCGRRPG